MEKSIDDSVREGPDISSPTSPITAFADNGIALIPQPSDDPEDPLNWTLFRKGRILFVICLASFAGNVAALAGQEAYPLQSKVYNVTVIESSYSVAAAMSGLATGAFFFVPFGHIVGRWSITFWSLLACLACGVWSACMTRESDYNNFIVSRLLSGLFGAVPSAVGGGMILDIFFLHQRGRAFICYEIAILFGATAGPTFSGFIAGTASWTWCFWWTVPFLAITALLVFVCAEETSYNRDGVPMQRSQSFVKSRIDTFFPGTAVVTIPSRSEIIKSAVAPFAIGLSPATVLCGLFTLVVFGWLLINDVLSPSFLQNPIEEGGYGFTPVQNAAFSMAGWIAIITSQVVGMFAHDGLPLWICKRFYNGVWRPELRLYVMGITAVFVPVGLGICGAALKQHYHYMVFALGYYIVAVAVLIAVPVATNYVAESYTEHGTECTLVMTFYRLAWGVAIPFFITHWIEEVGIAWVYGTAAFVTVAAWLMIQALLWKGPTLRQWSLAKSLVRSEEGQKLFEK